MGKTGFRRTDNAGYKFNKKNFPINAGLRIRGAYSRNEENPKHSFRLYFKGIYGDSNLKFPLFGKEGVATFDKIDLRTSQNYAWAKRDRLFITSLYPTAKRYCDKAIKKKIVSGYRAALILYR